MAKIKRAISRLIPIGEPEPPLPGLADMAVNFAVSEVRHIRDGRRKADDGLYAARLRVCQHGAGLDAANIVDGHCRHYRPSDGRCAARRCGCWVEDLPEGEPVPVGRPTREGKARRLSERCPLGWWPAVVIGPPVEPLPPDAP